MMAEEEAEALLVSVLDEVCWLLNIRGSDIEHSPVVVAYVLVTRGEGARFYVEMSGKVVPESVRSHLRDAGVQVCAYADLEGDLARLCAQDGKIWVEPKARQTIVVFENRTVEVRHIRPTRCLVEEGK